MRSRKSRGLRGYSCGSASARGVSNDTSSSSCAGGVVDSFERAELSSVSAKVMRRRGVSNDLRLRGDEWPLLKVVKGLSVVVATVVEEVSMCFGSAAPSALRYNLSCAQTWPLRLGCCSALARSCARLRTCRNAAYLRESRSNAAALARLAQISDFENPRPTSGTSVAKNLCARSPIPHEVGKDGLMLLCVASVPLAQLGLFRWGAY